MSLPAQSATCNRCGRDLAPDRNVFEAQEALQIDFLAGYASAFGDSNRITGLFCVSVRSSHP